MARRSKIDRTSKSGRKTKPDAKEGVSPFTWNNRWQEIKRLSGGGQSRAYIVRDLSGAEPDPLFLKTPRTISTKTRSRLREEVLALKALEGTVGVPRLVDASPDGDEPFIVMELVQGEALGERIKRGFLSYDEARTFLFTILNILDKCHSKGIVHRDLKPGNIMLKDAKYNEPVLVDFGIGFRDSKDRKQLTRSLEAFGNAFYQPPETLGGNPHQRSPIQDLSGTCALLLYVLTGESVGQFHNFHGELPHQRPDAIAKLYQLPYWHRAHLAQLFDRAFNPDIRKRFQSVQDLRDMLLKSVNAPSPIDLSTEDNLSLLRQKYSGRNQYMEETDALQKAADTVSAIYNEIVIELGPGFVVEIFPNRTYGTNPSYSLSTRLFNAADIHREFLCNYQFSCVGNELIVSTDVPSRPQLARFSIEHLEQGALTNLALRAKQFISAEAYRRLSFPNLNASHLLVYQSLQSGRLDELQAAVASVTDQHGEKCALGFEELSWFLKRQGILSSWNVGATTVVTQAGPQEVAYPSMFSMSADGVNAFLDIWSNQKIQAYRKAHQKFPGGMESVQCLLANGFEQRILDEILAGRTLPSLL